MGGETPAVEMRNIVKRFPGVLANDHVTFSARAGEVHALLGENGAGKTTLMNILYGLYHPDEGEIYVHGKQVTIHSPRDAIRLGIGMVHQHFMLVHSHTVAENAVLGLAGTPFLRPAQSVRQQIVELSERYRWHINPDAYIWQLSAGEQQRVEIVKALLRGARILILDEPTSMLTPGEARQLFSVLRQMAEEGRTVIFISHKLEEVMEVSDRVTVLRRGRVVGTVSTRDTSPHELARMMVGREVLFQLEKKPARRGDVVLRLEEVTALNDLNLPALREVTLDVHAGEIVGIAGVAGNGQRELVEVITGLRPVANGRIFLDGEEITHQDARFIGKRGVAHVPEDRLHMGVVPNLSVAENLILKYYDTPPFAQGWFLNRQAMTDFAQRKVEEYQIRTPTVHTPVKLLSGGNIQRLILARELAFRPRLVVAAHPTSGLDVGAMEHVRQLLLRQREEGAAILLVSEDLDEVLELSDRVAVMFGGRIVGIVEAAEADVETIGAMMAGLQTTAEATV